MKSSLSASYSIQLRPTPDAEAQPAAGEQVELGRLLGHEHRLALRQDQDAGDQLEALGDRAEEAEQHERLVVRHVGGVDLLAPRPVGVAADDVLGGEQVVEAGALDGLGEVLEEARGRCRGRGG